VSLDLEVRSWDFVPLGEVRYILKFPLLAVSMVIRASKTNLIK